MRLPQMTTRRWVLVVAVLALALVLVTRLVAPIVSLIGQVRMPS